MNEESFGQKRSMTSPDLKGLAAVFNGLRHTPIWLLVAAALGGFAALFIPAIGGVDLVPFRKEWGAWLWVEATFFSIAAVARSVDAFVANYFKYQQARKARRVLRFSPQYQQSFWSASKQQDDSFVSQVSIEIGIANMSDRSVRILMAYLLRPKPKGEVLNSMVTLFDRGRRQIDAIPPHGTALLDFHTMSRGSIGQRGKPLRVSLQVADQVGETYTVKTGPIRTHDVVAAIPWKDRIKTQLKSLLQLDGPADLATETRPAIWQHHGEFGKVDLVLIEEQRNYAANNRSRGGLGSLSVNLQTKPKDDTGTSSIESPNFARLLKIFASLQGAAKTEAENYLLSHLHKASPYASVGYLIFLALHRMGRSTDAVQAARTCLAGDKVFGYSNLLGTLAAVVAYEHASIPLETLAQFEVTLAGDTEHNFGLVEKINVARLKRLDSTLSREQF